MKIELDAVLYYAKRAGLTVTKRNGKLVVTHRGPLPGEWRALLAELKPRLLAVVEDYPEPAPASQPATRYGLRALPRPKAGEWQNYDLFDGLSPLPAPRPPRPVKAATKQPDTAKDFCFDDAG
jgi:hypothetical protein